MKITLHNIGKIGEATIELNGITIIAGENDTGKSTVGKALYSVFNSLYKINERIDRERRYSIEKNLDMYLPNKYKLPEFNEVEEAERLIERTKKNLQNPELVQKEIENYFIETARHTEKKTNESELKKIAFRIAEILHVSDYAVFKVVLFNKLNSEFNEQITNIYYPDNEGKIELTIKDNPFTISLFNDRITNISAEINLNTEVIYIDDPFILDEGEPSIKFENDTAYYKHILNHQEHLKNKLFRSKMESNVIGEIITAKKLENILSKINTVCSGEMVKTSSNSFGYKKNGGESILDIKNLSTGLKTFVILKTLLLKGVLEENGTIVLDEPEIHLHPKWQLLFAELIVLIQKEFGLHILINTHSPYFLRAIEVYSAEHETADKCKYYLSAIENEIATFEDVTIHTDKIYKKLATPLENLQIDRYRDD